VRAKSAEKSRSLRPAWNDQKRASSHHLEYARPDLVYRHAVAGRLLKHARYYWLLLAESHLTRRLFGAMLRGIQALPVPAG
jgi:hypothetical protein